MLTLVLTFFLLLSGHASCDGRSNKNTLRVSPQPDGKLLERQLKEVDSVNEPALRIFLRLKIAAYLLKNPSAVGNAESAVKAVEEALADLRAHKDEIPSLYVDLFRRELIAQLRTHAPTSEALSSEEPNLNRRTDLEVAYSMLGQEKGIDKAVDIARQSIASGKDPGPVIVPFLRRLEKVNPDAVPQLLEKVVLREEEHPGFISTSTLFTLKHLFLREKTAPDLQRRYLTIVINRAGDTDASPASVVNTYTILADVLPVVEKQAPDLYETFSIRLFNLAVRVPSGTRERIAINKRVSQSSDPLAQLLAESSTASDPSLKDDLQIEAAQLALEKGQIEMAVGLVTKLQPKNEDARLWRDQFIEGAVGRAIDKGDVGAARYGADQIQSPAIRSSALQKVALYLQVSNDFTGARDTLNAALKLTEASANSTDKAVALLDLAVSFLKIDNQRAAELARTAVNVINTSSVVVPDAKAGSKEQLRNADNLLKIAYKLIPAFQAFGATNEPAASWLAKDIQRPELRITATLGVNTRPPAAGKVASK
jgi:hypothetical protein